MTIPAPDEFVLQTAWPFPSQHLQRKVVEFWVGESALPEATAIERAKELMIVAHRKDGPIAAVCTVQDVFVPILNGRCFAYRTYIGSANRTLGLRNSGHLGWSLLTNGYKILNDFHAEESSEHLGLYMEIENVRLRSQTSDCVWTDATLRRRRDFPGKILDDVGPIGMNVVYLGTTPTGSHARAWYFDDSRVPSRAGKSRKDVTTHVAS